jgi:hypothetical protein
MVMRLLKCDDQSRQRGENTTNEEREEISTSSDITLAVTYYPVRGAHTIIHRLLSLIRALPSSSLNLTLHDYIKLNYFPLPARKAIGKNNLIN